MDEGHGFDTTIRIDVVSQLAVSAFRSEFLRPLGPLRFRAEAPEAEQGIAAADAVLAEIAEAFDRFLAAFGDRLPDDVVAGDHGGADEAAQLLDPAGDVDSVADDGELETLIRADIA